MGEGGTSFHYILYVAAISQNESILRAMAEDYEA